jgi:hypothetical protein
MGFSSSEEFSVTAFVVTMMNLQIGNKKGRKCMLIFEQLLVGQGRCKEVFIYIF